MEHLNKISGVRHYPKWFTEEEIQVIFRQILECKDYWSKKGYADWGKFFKMRDFALIASMYMLALRPREACELKFTDFDWARSILRVRGVTNKTKKDSPPIPVPQLLLKIYNKYFAFSRLRFWHGSKYLFPSFSNPHISSGTLKTIIREKVLKPLGLWEIPDGCIGKARQSYKMRHSRLRHIRNKQYKETGQVDIFSLANFARHADIRSTMAYLTDTEYLRKQIEL